MRHLLSLSALLLLAACAKPADTDSADTSAQDTADDTGSEDTGSAAQGQIVISELVAKNDSLETDENGDNDDWLVLENVGDAEVSLEGWSLTDDYEVEEPWALPSGQSLAPGATLRIWCDDEPEQGDLHANFKLSGDGETVHILDADGAIIQALEFPALEADQKYVRDANGNYAIE